MRLRHHPYVIEECRMESVRVPPFLGNILDQTTEDIQGLTLVRERKPRRGESQEEQRVQDVLLAHDGGAAESRNDVPS